MEVVLELLVLLLNSSLVVTSIFLMQLLAGSGFFNISKYLLVLALALIIHSASAVLISGTLGHLIYGLTALIVSLCYLLVVWQIYQSLRKISGGKQ